jgi:hypothetical protein
LEEAGLFPPILNPTLTAQAGGSLDGVYQVVITEYDKIHDIESDPGPSQQITLGNQYIEFSAWPPARNAATTHFRVYRGFAGDPYATPDEAAARDGVSVSPMARTLEVSVPPGAGFADNVDEDDLQELLTTAPISWWRGIPPAFSYPRLIRERLFGWGTPGFRQGTVTARKGSKYVFEGANCRWNRSIIGHRIAINRATDWYTVVDYNDASPDTIEIDPPFRDADVSGAEYHTWQDDGKLVWSQEDEPESFPVSNHRYIAKGQGLKGSGLGAVRGFPVMFAADQTWLLQFQSDPGQENMAQEQRLSGTVGCVSHNTIATITRNGTERLVWLSRYGIASTAGQGVDIVSDPPIYPGGLRDYFDNMMLDPKGEAQVACAVNHVPSHLYICAFPTEDSNVGCDEVVVWDYLNDNFWRWKFKWEVTSLAIGDRYIPDTDDANKDRRRPVVLIGTHHGYVYYWPTGENDGAGRDDTEGTVYGTVDEATETTLVDNSAEFTVASPESPPDLRGLDGAFVTVFREGPGYQHIEILTNTATELVVPQWEWQLQAGDEYWIGEIENFYRTPKVDFGSLIGTKRVEKLHVVFTPEDQGELEVTTYKDQDPTAMTLQTSDKVDLTGAENAVYGRANEDYQKGRAIIPVNARCHHFQWQVGNRRPNWPWTVNRRRRP